MAEGSVNTQAITRLRIVPNCKPDLLAAMAPATPEERICVVETGKPKISATAMVVMVTSSAEAPWA